MSLDPRWCKNCSTHYRLEDAMCLHCDWCNSCGCDPIFATSYCATCDHPTCPDNRDIDTGECPKCLDQRRLWEKVSLEPAPTYAPESQRGRDYD